ncbi:hypothetical protein, partial [Rhizobium phaseoli]|uniref:hypothetical protein n=1 Tax=Rhizobium phaseoli TaxID=396 RepID=UPI001AEE76AD
TTPLRFVVVSAVMSLKNKKRCDACDPGRSCRSPLHNGCVRAVGAQRKPTAADGRGTHVTTQQLDSNTPWRTSQRGD